MVNPIVTNPASTTANAHHRRIVMLERSRTPHGEVTVMSNVP